MQFLLPLFYILLFLLSIFKFNFFETTLASRSRLAIFFLLKIGAATAVFWIYTRHYSGGDLFTYFADSNVFVKNLLHGSHLNYSSAWTGDFNEQLPSGSRTMIILNAVLHVFSFGNFYANAVFICFFSFIGLVALLKIFSKHFPDKSEILFILFFIPTVLFFGSAPLKEAVIIGCSGLIIYLTDFGLRKIFPRLQILIIALLLLLLLFISSYTLFFLVPLLIINMINLPLIRSIPAKYLLIFGILAILLIAVAYISPDFNLLRIISDKQAKAISEAKGGVFLQNDRHFICIEYQKKDQYLKLNSDRSYSLKNGSSYLSWPLDNMSDTSFICNSNDTSHFNLTYAVSPAMSVVNIKKVKPEIGSILLALPQSIFNVMMRPSLLEIHSWLHMIVAVENLWLIIIILLPLLSFDKNWNRNREIVIFCFTFSFLLFALIGLCTPVPGAIIRYRVLGLIFFMVGCLLITDFAKLRTKFRRK